MLCVQLGCERRFNIQLYDADSHFCHSVTSRDLTWSSGRLTRQLASHISWGVTNVSSVLISIYDCVYRAKGCGMLLARVTTISLSGNSLCQICQTEGPPRAIWVTFVLSWGPHTTTNWSNLIKIIFPSAQNILNKEKHAVFLWTTHVYTV